MFSEGNRPHHHPQEMIQMATTTKTRSSKSGMENSEYAQMMRRMVRTYERRLSNADPTDLMDAIEIMREMDAMIGRAVREMKSAGFSWADIATYTGTTRQAAQQRWGKAKG